MNDPRLNVVGYVLTFSVLDGIRLGLGLALGVVPVLAVLALVWRLT